MKLLLFTALFTGALATASSATTLIIPVFGNTSSQYNGVVRAARDQNLVAIVNPDNGPGSRKIGSTAKFVNSVQGAGSEAIGYIATSYGSRGIGSVKASINAYVSRYGMDGIFLDQMSDQKSEIGYYREVYEYARSKGLKVYGNPGTFVPEGYADVADVLITYEDMYGAGYSKFKQKKWTKKYKKSKFGVIVNSTSNYSGVVSRAQSQNVEYVFATDGDEPSPYGSLPSDFGSLSGLTSGGAAAGASGGGSRFRAVPEPTVTLSGAVAAGFFLLRRRRNY